MRTVRPLAISDIPDLARLFVKTFRDGGDRASPELVSYLEHHYLAGPFAHPDVPPLVHIDDTGRLTGFVGVNTLPMRLGERRLRVAVCGALMVENPAVDPMAGARLLRVFLAGPQDLSISETANDVSIALWTRLGGQVLPGYSLEWLRILRPTSFVVDRIASRVPAFVIFKPLALGIDRLLVCRNAKAGPRWSCLGDKAELPRGLVVEPIDTSAFADAFSQLTQHFRLRPDFDTAELDYAVAEAASIRQLGEARAVTVRTIQGEVVGSAFFYYRPKGLATVLQIVAGSRRLPAVLDALLAHLHANGAIGVVGRSQPALVEASLDRRIGFLPFVATVGHARDPGIMEAIKSGDAFLNGFVGEKWSRLVECRFE